MDDEGGKIAHTQLKKDCRHEQAGSCADARWPDCTLSCDVLREIVHVACIISLWFAIVRVLLLQHEKSSAKSNS
jgi:hypothetical protein